MVVAGAGGMPGMYDVSVPKDGRVQPCVDIASKVGVPASGGDVSRQEYTYGKQLNTRDGTSENKNNDGLPQLRSTLPGLIGTSHTNVRGSRGGAECNAMCVPVRWFEPISLVVKCNDCIYVHSVRVVVHVRRRCVVRVPIQSANPELCFVNLNRAFTSRMEE